MTDSPLVLVPPVTPSSRRLESDAIPTRGWAPAGGAMGSPDNGWLVPIEAIGVVVPARNEEIRLARCLDALTVSAAALQDSEVQAPPVRILVVDDLSTDATAQIAAGRPGVEVVSSTAGRVGGARRRGIRRLLRSCRSAGLSADEVWIACTDADSAVPPDWLLVQLQHARAGVDLLLGTVRPDPTELAGGVLAAWRLRHELADGHPHVHGANLGVRGDSYLAAGGFRNVAAHEDVLLADAVRGRGGVVVSTGAGPVLTSGRQHGRTPAGMAHYLRELDGFDQQGRDVHG